MKQEKGKKERDRREDNRSNIQKKKKKKSVKSVPNTLVSSTDLAIDHGPEIALSIPYQTYRTFHLLLLIRPFVLDGNLNLAIFMSMNLADYMGMLNFRLLLLIGFVNYRWENGSLKGDGRFGSGEWEGAELVVGK